MKTLKEMLAEARQVIPEQGPNDLKRRLDAGEPLVLIDVRDPTSTGTASSSPPPTSAAAFSSSASASAAADPTTPIVLYCQTGLRSMLAAKALHELGYENVVNLQGGFQKWAQSGMPVVKDRPLTTEQIQRYSRHFLLARSGEKGQRKLLRSKVLLIGAGGLGSPTALYLAAAGVGTIGLMDGDIVDVSNLQRQILHTTANVGRPKVESRHRDAPRAQPRRERDSAADAHRRRQRDGHHQGLRSRHRRLGQLRHALSRQRRLLSGAARPTSTGRSSSSRAWPPCSPRTRGPCYRCLYPTPPPPGLVPS